jgi:hypothetical protein
MTVPGVISFPLILGIGSFRPEDAIIVLGRCALTGKIRAGEAIG